MKKRVYKLIAGLLMVTMIIALVGCKETSPDPVTEPSSQAEESSVKQPEESSKPEASAPEAPEKEDPVEFAKKILADNADISETELRVQLYKAGYTAAEIKTAVETVMPREENPDKQESSKPEESSKPAESSESSSESSKTEESSKQEESSKNEESKQTEDQNQESEEIKSGPGTNESSKPAESSKQEESSKQQESSKTESSSQQQQESSKPQESSKTEESSKQEESKPESSTQQQESQTSTCDHEWVDVTEVVHHDAVTEEVWVVDEAAWDETVNKTENQQVRKYQCSCGQVFDSTSDWENHVFANEDNIDAHISWSSIYVDEEVVVGTETIHHDEVGHYETRTVTEAYDETVVTGQKCSKCGATK